MRTSAFVWLAVISIACGARAAYWHTDFGEAQMRAYGENRTILIYFTCSDGGGTCERLRQEVFSKYEFQVFADRHLVLVEADFPRRKPLEPAQVKANRALADKYHGYGVPAVVLVNNRGQAIGRWGYLAGGPDAYIKAIERAARLTEKTAASDSEEGLPLFSGAPMGPPPKYKELTLKSISGTGAKRLALINNVTLGAGENGKVLLGATEVKIRCEEIHDASVIVTVEGSPARRELPLVVAVEKSPSKETAPPQQANVNARKR